MSTVERIQELLNCVNRITERDSAGIITAAGIDAKIQAAALTQCLKIAQDEEKNRDSE